MYKYCKKLHGLGTLPMSIFHRNYEVGMFCLGWIIGLIVMVAVTYYLFFKVTP